jgi:ribosomal protein S6--L-glutamate ligase/gamma-F420-2:alpha-L-glutamate ligase
MKLNRSGWIIYNGNLQSDKFLDFAEMMQDAAVRLNSKAVIMKNNDLFSLLSSSALDVLPVKDRPDYVIFLDKDIYLAKQLEYLGIPVYNSADAIATSDDKIATYQKLSHQKLSIPKTLIAPKIFHTGRFNEAIIDEAIAELGMPMIIKEAFGSFGEQVYLIESKDELFEKMKEIGNKPFMFQSFIETSYGVDVRLQVVGNRVVAAMKRKAMDDFRANVTSGASMEPYFPSKEEATLAIKATKALNADFAGVDLLFGEQGKPIVCEVNSNAHIRNLYDCTGINAADDMMEHILNSLNKQP